MSFLDNISIFPFSTENKLKVLKNQYFKEKFILQNTLKNKFYFNTFFNLFNRVIGLLENYYMEYKKTRYINFQDEISFICKKLCKTTLKNNKRKNLKNQVLFLINLTNNFFMEVKTEIDFLLSIYTNLNLKKYEYDFISYFNEDFQYHKNYISKVKEDYLDDIFIA